MPWEGSRDQQISELYQCLTGTLLNDLPIVALRLLREGTVPALLREAVEGQLRLRREVRRDPERKRAMRELLDLIEEEEQTRLENPHPPPTEDPLTEDPPDGQE